MYQANPKLASYRSQVAIFAGNLYNDLMKLLWKEPHPYKSELIDALKTQHKALTHLIQELEKEVD